jgi:hypothetical protein
VEGVKRHFSGKKLTFEFLKSQKKYFLTSKKSCTIHKNGQGYFFSLFGFFGRLEGK